MEEALPYLTYLSVVGYDLRADGTLSSINETMLIEAARQKGVAPLMVVSNIDRDGRFSPELAHTVLSDVMLYQTLINYIIATLKTKNYYGVNLNLTELYPNDYMFYAEFLQSLTKQLHPLGYIVVVAPRISALIEEQEALAVVNSQLPSQHSGPLTFAEQSGVAPTGNVQYHLSTNCSRRLTLQRSSSPASKF